MNINERTLEPSTYQEDTMERIRDYLAVDTESGTIMAAVNIRLVHRDCFPEGDEELSDSEVSALAMERGIYLDDYSVN